MENIAIKKADVQMLFDEYRKNIESNLLQLKNLSDKINALIYDKVNFLGKGAENIQNYYGQVHMVMIAGIMEATKALLTEVAVYKDGYDNIDASEGFHYNKSASKDLYLELQLQSAQMVTYHEMVRKELLNIADIYEGNQPMVDEVQENMGEVLGI